MHCQIVDKFGSCDGTKRFKQPIFSTLLGGELVGNQVVGLFFSLIASIVVVEQGIGDLRIVTISLHYEIIRKSDQECSKRLVLDN